MFVADRQTEIDEVSDFESVVTLSLSKETLGLVCSFLSAGVENVEF